METTTASGIVDSLTSSFSTVATDGLSAISSILPIALPVLGAYIVIRIGIKIFKRVTG